MEPAMDAFTGRAVPLEMGQVRFGGSGRPVTIHNSSSNHSLGDAVNGLEGAERRQQPCVVLEPQPRSPFGRKLETSVSVSLSSEESNSTRFHVQKTTVVTHQVRVHTTHHSRRTPLTAAARQREAAHPASRPSVAAPPTVAEEENDEKEATRPSETAHPTTKKRPNASVHSTSNIHHVTARKTKAPRTVREPNDDMVSGGETPRGATVQQISATAPPYGNVAPRDMALFTHKVPSPSNRQGKADVSFHEHVRLQGHANDHVTGTVAAVVVGSAAAIEGDEEEQQQPETRSGWRDVDDSIDYIYEDPSIDVVQLQLLLHGHRTSGVKRKALERERLHIAAAEVHKQQQSNAHHMEELQRRKSNILKLSEQIRSRNKPSAAKNAAPMTAVASSSVRHARIPAPPARKPPVPRLSQLDAKPTKPPKEPKQKTVKKTSKTAGLPTANHLPEGKQKQKRAVDEQDDDGASDGDSDRDGNRDGGSDGSGDGDHHPDGRASDSILLGQAATEMPANTNMAKHEKPVASARSATKKRKPNKPSSASAGKTTTTTTTSSSSTEEKLQRRALAREYMQIQKQSRHIVKAKMDEQKRMEEQKRKLELQRLEFVRMRELEEAKRRRIKQKQRDRVALQHKLIETKANEQEQDLLLLHAQVDLSVGAERTRAAPLDAENQSFRGNQPAASGKAKQSTETDTFQWPGSDHDSISPRDHESGMNKEDSTTNVAAAPSSSDPRIAKLLALGERTKMLTEKLQSLSRSSRVKASIQAMEAMEKESSRPHDGEDDDDDVASRDVVDEEEEEEEGEQGDGHSRSRSGSDSEFDDDEEDDEEEEEDDDDDDGKRSVRKNSLRNDRGFPSMTRIQRERAAAAAFETANAYGFGNAEDEFDFASVGVQSIRVMWPDDNEGAGNDCRGSDADGPQSSRFEVLPSSSSSSPPSRSSSSSSPSSTSPRRKTDRWLDSHASSQHSSASSPKLLEESVGGYTQRLLDRSQRSRGQSRDDETHAINQGFVHSNGRLSQTVAASQGGEGDHLRTATWLGGDASPVVSRRQQQHVGHSKQRQQHASSDAELLRLIRESDDNLSVIDKEAKRRFRLQQERLRQRRDEQDRIEEEKLRARLRVVEPATVGAAQRDTADTGHDSVDHKHQQQPHEAATAGTVHIERLESILQAVAEESSADDGDAMEEKDAGSDSEPHANKHQPPPVVSFWNSQLSASRGPLDTQQPRETPRPAHRSRHVEIDRRDLQQQRVRQLEREDEEDQDEQDESSERMRLLSPQTLGKRLIAAVEYHEAIHDAHLQLTTMEKTQALEQVQQDTIALAQAFKDEMESNLLTQQLEEEHAHLEAKFDTDLKQVVDQLEVVRDAEQREHAAELKRLQETARVAKQRESSVQTEPKQHSHAATSARLRVEAAVSTDHERVDMAVQYETTVTKDHAISPVEEAEEEEVDEEYGEDTFDQGSISQSRVKKAPISDKIQSKMRESSEGSVRSSFASVESEPDDATSQVPESEEEEDEEIASATSMHHSDGDENASSAIVEEDEDEDVALSFSTSSPTRRRIGEQSASVNDYDADDFEEEISTNRVDHKAKTGHDNGDDVSVHSSAFASEDHDEGTVSKDAGVDDEDVDDYSSISDGDKTPVKPLAAQGKPQPMVAPAVIKHEPPLKAYIGDRPTATNSTVTWPAVANATGLTAAAGLAFHRALPSDVADAYLLQLENRRQSEQALLDIRLGALESQLQQEMQRVVDEIASTEKKKTATQPQALDELTRRKSALQMAFLSEKANIESQKSACVSRYYQDLLVASQSLGVLPSSVTSARAMLPTAVARARPSRLLNSSTLPVQATVSEPQHGSHEDDDGYSEDDFGSVASEYSTTKVNGKEDAHELASVGAASAQSSDVAEEEEISSMATKNVDDEDGDAEEEIQSDVEEKEGGDEDNKDYEDEEEPEELVAESNHSEHEASAYDEYEDEFASISEHGEKTIAAAVVQDDEEDRASIASIADELPSKTTLGDAAEVAGEVASDDEDVYEEDEFASASGSTAMKDSISDEQDDESPKPTKTEQSIEPLHDESSIAVAASASQSDDSSTTKLLGVEIAMLHDQIKDHEARVASPLLAETTAKIQKKKAKAQELLHAKETLIQQQVNLFRHEEEREQVNTIAQLALGLDVNSEVAKAKSVVKETLRSEFETLKQAYPELIGHAKTSAASVLPLHPVVTGVTSSTKTTAPVGRVQSVAAEEDVEEEYADEEDYEVDSFEKEAASNGSASVEEVEEVADRQSESDKSEREDEIEESAREEQDHQDAVRVSAAVADVEIEEEEDDEAGVEKEHSDVASVVDDDEDGDEYGNDSFDEDQSMPPDAFDNDGNGHVAIGARDIGNDETVVAAAAAGNTETRVVAEEADEEDDDGGGYSEDDDFEASASRRSSLATQDNNTTTTTNAHDVAHTAAAAKQQDEVAKAKTTLEVSDMQLELATADVMVQLQSTLSPSCGEMTIPLRSYPMKPAAQSLSLPVSHHSAHSDEDFATASMDEQVKRIEDLKHQIEQRKQEYIAVQKQFKIEKKKEHLRAAETKLWNAMGQLEEQLIADEKLLSLTRQRGRLEAMVLETKHSDSRMRGDGNGDNDLLAGYDYCEAVELVKSPVVMQDTQIQVRLPAAAAPPMAVDTRMHGSEKEEDGVDFLLACDYVETAERPVVAVATSTESSSLGDQEVEWRDTHSKQVVAESAENELVASRDDGDEAMERRDQGGHLEEMDERIVVATSCGIDPLESYDYVEAVEAVEDDKVDLLDGYDYVEPVDELTHEEAAKKDAGVLGDERVASQVDGIGQFLGVVDHEERSVFDQDEKNILVEPGSHDIFGSTDKCKGSGSSDDEDGEEEEETEIVADDANSSGDLVDGEVGVPTENFEEVDEVEVSVDEEEEKHAVPPFELSPANVTDTDAHDPLQQNRIARMSDDLLAFLVKDAVAEIYMAASSRRSALTQERISSYSTGGVEVDAASTATANLAGGELDGGDGEADDEVDDEVDSEDAGLGVSGTPTTTTTTATTTTTTASMTVATTSGYQEQLTGVIVDRLMEEWTTTEVRESVSLYMNKRGATMDPPTTRHQPPVAPPHQSSVITTTTTTKPPLQAAVVTDQLLAQSLIEQLRLSSEAVTLPRLEDCSFPVGHSVSSVMMTTTNTRAIYDAVLHIATHVHKRLVYDPIFQQEDSKENQKKLLVDKVHQEMDLSVWAVQRAAQDAQDQVARKLQDDEQGELDPNDLRLLLAQQRSDTFAVRRHFQATALVSSSKFPSEGSSSSKGRQQRSRRTAAKHSTTQHQHQQHPALVTQLLQQEEELLVDRISSHLLHELLTTERPAFPT